MKKDIRHGIGILLMFLAANGTAQTLVSTSASNKNAILEDFEGVLCQYTPEANYIADSILLANPSRVFIIEYHPTNNATFTAPYSGNPDFRKAYPNALYTTSYSSTISTPGGYINRMTHPITGSKNYGRHDWGGRVDYVQTVSSPVNVGLAASYDGTSEELTVTVEVYYTDYVFNNNNINVILNENNLVAKQNSGGDNYVHNHVFREALTSQWGELITGSTNQGSLISKSYTYDNSTTQYDMNNCEVVVFISEGINGEIITGNGVNVNETTSLDQATSNYYNLEVFPNPSDGLISISGDNVTNKRVNLEIWNTAGAIIYKKEIESGASLGTIDLSKYGKGIYFIKLRNEGITTHSKVVIH